jgi:hypothetical protein
LVLSAIDPNNRIVPTISIAYPRTRAIVSAEVPSNAKSKCSYND